MTRKPEEIRQALDTTLSGASHDPTLYNRVVNASKGESPTVKRKLTLSMAFVMILVLMTGTVAVAATYRGVSWFLTEHLCITTVLDPDYVFSDMRQHHNSKYLDATVIDAYWDGLELYITYRVAPVDPTQILRMDCEQQDTSDADLLLWEPDFISVTDYNNPERPHPYTLFCDWKYEEDGSITVFVSFPHYDMSQPDSISIPIFNKVASTQEINLSMLHFYQPTLADPIAAHEHSWIPATCVAPKTCTICGRTDGELGYHDFQPTDAEDRLACAVCTQSNVKPFNIPATMTIRPGDYNNFVLALQLKLNELGCYNGPFSGVYDEATIAAVNAYQEGAGLPIRDICGSETIQSLFP